jgi:single-strand DNA-binding protein
MNTCIFIGNLTREPELRVSQAGTSVCTFTIAVNRPKDQNGESKADFIPVKCFKNRADSCQRYLHKGSKVSVKGTLQTYTYQAQDGSRRNGFEIVVGNDGEISFLPSAQRSDGGGYSAPAQSSSGGGYPASDSGFTQVDDDELPF